MDLLGENMQFQKIGLVAALSALLSGVASAQEMSADVDEGSVYRSSWNASGEIINFDPEVAAYNGISDSGVGMGFGYSGEKGLFNFNVGLSAFFIDDKEEFSQRVESNWGGESTEDSSISAISLQFDGGVQYPVTESGNFVVGLNLGYRYLDISREIANCSNCYSENVSIGSDTYLKPFARLAFNDRISGTLALYNYAGDEGVDNSVQFVVDWRI